ncbi:MAG: PKD domain-containing protein [Candidatus Bathyarchaeota archaeon]|nr:PKD domain-containing protein [Candidatus Bathyarchaeota archaeon]
MKEKASSVALLVMLLLGTLTLAFNSQLVNAEPDTIYVDDDNVAGPWDGSQLHPYQNITSGLEHAASGDTIFVYNGTYHEHVSIEKPISLVGQNPFATIVDGGGKVSPIIHIFNVTNVVVSNFTVQNTTSSSESYGILIWQARNVTIQNNVVVRNYYNILLGNSTFCKILDNKIADSYNSGIVFRSGSSYNEIISNSIVENPNGIYIEAFSQNNTFYRNNIINNTRQVNIFPPAPSSWDNGVEGNYWSDYEGTDQDGDGIGDTGLLPHLGVDSYPLIEIWNKTRTYHVDPYEVVVNCNYTVASFKFNQTLRQISFYITGPSGWNGYCNVTIPKELLSPQNASEKWIVMLGPNPITYTNKTFNNSTRISFKYTLGSSMVENRVRVKVGALYPPTASFEFAPDPASIIEPVNFTDTSEDGPNGTIVWRQWNFGDGSHPIETNETLVAHQFESKVVFNVTLTVKDENNLTDSLTKPVRVDNLGPFANFTFSPTKPFVGLEVSFNASKPISGDVDGNITDYRWDFGDGNIANDSIVVHTFEQAGNYEVNLTVRDNDGVESSIVQTIPVGKGVAEVEIEAPTTVKVEQLFAITATLWDYYASQPLSGEQIEFYVYDNDLVLSRNGTTDIDGMARAIFSLSISGDYSIEVKYKGSKDHLESNSTKLITVNPLTTALTVQTPKNVTQNEESMMFATLLDENESPVHNATVEFHSYNGNIWKLLGSSKTNQSGVASFSYISQFVGTFMLKAVFNGTEMYAASNSSEYSFTVVASEIDYVPYIILAAAIAIVVCLMYVALKRRKTPSDVQPNDRETSSPS